MGTESHTGNGSFVRRAKRLAVIVGAAASKPEKKAADLLARRISSRSALGIRVAVEATQEATQSAGAADLVFLVGSPGSHRQLRMTAGLKLPRLPNSDDLHPEGYSLKTLHIGRRPHVIVAGVDERGTLYGVGALLRLLTYHPRSLDVPVIDLVDRPRFWLRGGEVSAGGPRSGAMEQGHMRPQTKDELYRITEELMLLGANVFQGEDEFVRSYGMMTYGGCVANALPAFPPDWAAVPATSLHVRVMTYFQRSFVCPSNPQARKALGAHYEKMFRDGPEYDLFTTNSGDVGGCDCGRCTPWGGTYARLVREMADILHRHHPSCKLLATNQNLTNEGNQALLDYVKDHPSGWLYALRYSPGSNEMDTYNRGPVNPRWFEYEGFGPLGNYLKHIHHELPPATKVALFTDITHWIRSQNGVSKPDVAMAAIYGRRAWNGRPRALHRVATELLHYAVGDMFYSEGLHDDFNKWFWYRMLWDPRQSPEEITLEYCRYWFGDDAKREMAQAIFLMEETLEGPVRGDRGMEKAIRLLRSACRKIPANLLKDDFRWRTIMQKALLDRYIQLRLERGQDLKRRASALLRRAVSSADPRVSIEKALEVLARPQETEEMRIIKDEVKRLGEETNRIIGYREPAYFTANDYDVTEIGWWTRTLRDAVADANQHATRNAAGMILNYEDPGEGGFYERAGWPWGSQHLLEESDIVGFFPFTGPAKPGHYGMAYSWGRKDSHLTFVYGGLDPNAQYVLRMSTGFHCEGLEKVMDPGTVQRLEVNGELIDGNVPLKLGEMRLLEFDLPRRLTKGGKATIVLRVGDGFPMVGLSEIWLMNKEKMKWTVTPR